MVSTEMSSTQSKRDRKRKLVFTPRRKLSSQDAKRIQIRRKVQAICRTLARMMDGGE